MRIEKQESYTLTTYFPKLATNGKFEVNCSPLSSLVSFKIESNGFTLEYYPTRADLLELKHFISKIIDLSGE